MRSTARSRGSEVDEDAVCLPLTKGIASLCERSYPAYFRSPSLTGPEIA